MSEGEFRQSYSVYRMDSAHFTRTLERIRDEGS